MHFVDSENEAQRNGFVEPNLMDLRVKKFVCIRTVPLRKEKKLIYILKTHTLLMCSVQGYLEVVISTQKIILVVMPNIYLHRDDFISEREISKIIFFE